MYLAKMTLDTSKLCRNTFFILYAIELSSLSVICGYLYFFCSGQTLEIILNTETLSSNKHVKWKLGKLHQLANTDVAAVLSTACRAMCRGTPPQHPTYDPSSQPSSAQNKLSVTIYKSLMGRSIARCRARVMRTRDNKQSVLERQKVPS